MGLENGASQPSLPLHFQLIEIWERLLRRPVRSIRDDFYESGGTSRLELALLREVQSMTGAKVRRDHFRKCPTIEHLAESVLAQSDPDEMYVCVQEGNGKVPFYFFHGDILGGGFYSRGLGEFLEPDQPFYVSPPIMLRENELPCVEELAARKRRVLQKQQPHGPYILGGFSVGAVVSFEVARQLRERGEDVRSVLLVDPELGDVLTRSHLKLVSRVSTEPQARVQAFMRGLRKIETLRHVLRAPLREKGEFLMRNTRKLLRARRTAPRLARETVPRARRASRHEDWLLSAYHWVVTSYVPRAYDGRIAVFVSDNILRHAPGVLKHWRKAVREMHVETIPGEHLSCITRHLGTLAAKMRREIDYVQQTVKMA